MLHVRKLPHRTAEIAADDKGFAARMYPWPLARKPECSQGSPRPWTHPTRGSCEVIYPLVVRGLGKRTELPESRDPITSKFNAPHGGSKKTHGGFSRSWPAGPLTYIYLLQQREQAISRVSFLVSYQNTEP